MEPDYWHARWRNCEIAFHEAAGNALLLRHFPALGLAPGARVFLPLCGKTRDIGWLLSQGYLVVGAELSTTAIDQLFEDLDVTPEVTRGGPLVRYSAGNLVIHVGDIFNLTAQELGPVDGICDRAALVALPAEMRSAYAAHLHGMTSGAAQLLICFEYDQSGMAGPPFSVDTAEIARLYDARYEISELERKSVEGGLKGYAPVTETASLLRARA